ncbi:MAG: FtsX-like permease family protein [Xanthomonadaceae bacterium]|nr:FtsX-like permease family protein [Xanthomonadaceae bacterium]
MFGSATQAAAITAMNVRNMRERFASSIVALIGIAGVVTVLVGVLSIREGFRAALDYSGSPDIAIVLRGGSSDELSSGFGQDQARIVMDSPHIARDADGPIASAELYVIVDVPMKSTGTAANVPFRGVGQNAPKLRKNFRITEGRMFVPGTFEVIVGAGAAEQFEGLVVGNTVRWGTTDWRIVGRFEDKGSVSESEVWTDATVLQGAYNRGNSYQSVRAKLTSADALTAFRDSLSNDPRVNTKVYSESAFYQEQSEALRVMITGLGFGIAILMGLGAVFAALNTMYSAVSARTREIATLRALGFGSFPVVISVIVEALLIALIGSVIGMLISYFAFNGIRASTLNFGSFTQLSFAFTVTPELLLQGLIYALVLGFIGGLLPSLRAARLPIVTGLREL